MSGKEKDRTMEPALSQPLKKRDKFLVEATQQFNAHGYYDTRLADIADAFGVGKTTVSYHFKSKESLLASAYEQTCDFSEQALGEAKAAENGLERSIRFVKSHLDAHASVLSGHRLPLALMNDISALPETEHDFIRRRYASQIQSFRQFLVDGQKDGSVSVASLDATTFFAFNVMNWIPQWLEAVPESRRDSSIDAFCDLLRYGLCEPGNHPKFKPVSRNNADSIPAIFDRETRNNLKREAFLRTGIRYLNRNGYRNLSLDDIAKELGVTRGAFYYHIADKETFLVESFNRTCDLIEDALEAAVKRNTDPALIQLERSVRWLFEGHLTELDPLLRLNLQHLLDRAPRAAINARLKRLRALYAELLAEGMMDGSIRPIDVEAAEYIIFGAIFSASGRRFAATSLNVSWRPHEEPGTAAEAYFSPLILGIAARS